jgi:hypothetical protein
MFRQAMIVLTLLTTAALADQPKFSDFPAEVYTGKVAKPILDTADKRNFRTRINEAAKGKPDFAGHFIMVKWGCGASCLGGAVLDAETGAVEFLPWSVCCSSNFDLEPLDYHANSRLLIANGMLNEEEPDTAHHFEFDGSQFKPLAGK